MRTFPRLAAGCVLGLLTAAAPAHAIEPEVRAGVGVGAMVSDRQQDQGYGLAAAGELRPALRLDDALAIELALASWFFPSEDGTGRATLIGAGLRVDVELARKAALFLDAHGGLGLTGPNERFMFDGGLGLELAVSRRFAVGPFVRYGQMLDSRADPKFLAGGILVAWRGRPAPPPPAPVAPPPPPAPVAPPPPPDQDRDGVVDGEDVCPDIAQGDRPDAKRRGCPFTDTDNDGVGDSEDLCVEPAGATPDPEKAGCPDGDQDGDGVSNSQDRCRDKPAGLSPDTTMPGCPLADGDGDAVPDVYDACRDKAGAPNADPKKNGCPGLVQIEEGAIKILKPVYFATGKDVILPRSFPVLGAVAAALKLTTGIKKVSIEGHTDDKGDEAANHDLSQRRAESVRRWLIEHGVEGERLEAKGFGPSRPVVPNTSAKARAQNRRVEFVIVDPAAPPAAAKPATGGAQ